MKTTAAVLKALQDHYASLPIRPSIKEIANASNMPVATTGRYLNGTTQTGDIERVRALCIALDRHDLLDELPKATTISTFQDALALIMEIKKESRESNLEELERVRQTHEDAEKRWERIIEGKDKSIEILSRRIERLEKDKENLEKDKGRQEFINTELNTEMKFLRESNRHRDVALIVALLVIVAMLIGIVVYLVKFDLPNPGYGILP